MVEFDDQVRRDLAKLRAREGPPAAVKQRMFAALELELGGGGGGGGSELGGGGSAPAGTGGLAYATKLVAVTVALTAAGVLVLQLGVRGARALASKPSAPVVATELPANSAPGPVVTSEPTRSANAAESSSTPEAEPALQPANEALSAQGSGGKAAPTSAAEGSVDSSEAEPEPEAGAPLDTLDAELEQINTARGAASPAAALEALERHLERFPAGQLSAERDLLRVEALCALGRREAATTIRERFARQHPDSPHASRMRAACD